MKARIRLHKLLSVLLCCIMLVGMLPTHAYAWETEAECDFCHEFIADDWICDGGNHCSESSDHTSCYEENHCQVCGGCRDDDWCDDCHMHIDCARDEGLHCSNCGACFYDVTPCPRCNETCSDCADWCDECEMCVDCGVNANKHCPDCRECTANAGCLVCYRCFECGGMCDAGCDDLCLLCHREEGAACESCGTCFIDNDNAYCRECGQCADCAGSDICEECQMCKDCGIAADKHCPDCGECTASAGCLVCHRCFDCGSMCDAGCDDLCLLCHREEGAACESCGTCFIDNDNAYCRECGQCADCAGSDICEECQMCKDCGIAANKHCPDCGECTASAGCQVCYRCFDCGGICDAGCDDLCLRCHREESVACENCGACYVSDDSVYCHECLLCADCAGSDICADCKMCVECAIDQNKHCPGCQECLEQAESFCKTCYYCASCAEICPICGSACSECGTVCPDCGTCENCATICMECGNACSECGTICEFCGLCEDCCEANSVAAGCSHGICVISSGWDAHWSAEHAGQEHTHSYGSEWKSDADKHWLECACGVKSEEAAHTAGDWITDTAATSTTAGTKHKACTECGYVMETGTIPATGSDHTHSYGSEWKSDADKHWLECACGVKFEEAAHTAGDWITDTAATSTTAGTKHKECTECGYVMETGTIPATGSDHTHSYGSEWKSDADKHWLECACSVKSEEAAHTASDWIIDTAATAATDGTKHKECTVCERVLETDTIPATGSDHTHSYGSEWKSDADKHWFECACSVKSEEAAHTAGDWITDTAATSTTAGTKHKECTECGYVMEIGTIPATGSSSSGGGSSSSGGGSSSSDGGSSSSGGGSSSSGGGSSSSGGGSSSGGSYRKVSGTRNQYTGTWRKDSGGWWYHHSDSYPKNEWKLLTWDGTSAWYFFDEAGYMKTGWHLSNGKWYYLGEVSDGTLGAMKTGWVLDPNDAYWYYLNPGDGAMRTGWLEAGGRWYYLNEGKTRPLGAMYRNEKTPDGCIVDDSGAWKR